MVSYGIAIFIRLGCAQPIFSSTDLESKSFQCTSYLKARAIQLGLRSMSITFSFRRFYLFVGECSPHTFCPVAALVHAPAIGFVYSHVCACI